MEKLFALLLGILLALFGKAKFDLYRSKKQAQQATSESLRIKTETEAAKSTITLESKLKDVLKEQASALVTPSPEAVPSEPSPATDEEAEIILRVYADGQVEEVRVPDPPTISTSQRTLSETTKEEALKQLERARRLRNL